jgi:hypothetical protein
MAITAASPTKIAVGSLYAASANEIEIGTDVETNDATTFGTAPFKAYTPGLMTVVMVVKGYQDFSTLATDSSSERTRAVAGTIVPVSVAPLGATDGNLAAFSVGLVTQTARIQAKVGDNPTMAIAFQPRGTPLVEGFVSDAGTTDRTASYNGVNAQLGAVSATQKVYANIHVLDTTGAGGTPSITPRIESDTVGFPSPVTIVTGSALTPAVGTGASSTISVAGPFTDDYFRVAFTISGTTPHLKIFAVVGVAKLTV